MGRRLANMFLEAILLQTVPSGDAGKIMGSRVHPSETDGARSLGEDLHLRGRLPLGPRLTPRRGALTAGAAPSPGGWKGPEGGARDPAPELGEGLHPGVASASSWPDTPHSPRLQDGQRLLLAAGTPGRTHLTPTPSRMDSLGCIQRSRPGGGDPRPQASTHLTPTPSRMDSVGWA